MTSCVMNCQAKSAFLNSVGTGTELSSTVNVFNQKLSSHYSWIEIIKRFIKCDGRGSLII